MPKDPSNPGSDDNKSRAQLIRDLADLRIRLAAEEQRCRMLSRALSGSRQEGFALGEIIPDANGNPIPERRQAEEAVRESEALYRSIARHFPDGAIFIFDHDLRFRVADGQAVTSLGYSREALEGRTVREAVDEETGRVLEQRYRRVLAGESFHFETSFKGRVFLSAIPGELTRFQDRDPSREPQVAYRSRPRRELRLAGR